MELLLPGCKVKGENALYDLHSNMELLLLKLISLYIIRDIYLHSNMELLLLKKHLMKIKE